MNDKPEMPPPARVPFKKMGPLSQLHKIMETRTLGQPGAIEFGVSHIAGPGPMPDEDRGR